MNFSPYIFGATAITVVTVASPTIVMALEPTQINEIATNITVKIERNEGIDREPTLGSGVIVARNDSTYYVLTAKHVVERPDYEHTIFTVDGEGYILDPNTIHKIDGVDLAVISFRSDRSYKTAQIETSASRIVPGMPVYVNGFPKAGQEIQGGAQFTSGSLTGINSQHRSGYNLVYSNFTRGGMSGGPVLNAQGKLIGIHGLAEQEINEANNNCQSQQLEQSAEANLLPPKLGETNSSSSAEASLLPPKLGETNSSSSECQPKNNVPEKIDLNLGISIVTFVERAATIGINIGIDPTVVNTPRRTPRDTSTVESGTACSAVNCP